MIWDEFLRHFRFCDEEDSGLSDEEQERKGPKNRPKHTRKRVHQAKKNFLEKFKTASKWMAKRTAITSMNIGMFLIPVSALLMACGNLLGNDVISGMSNITLMMILGIVVQALAECFISPRYLEYFSLQAPEGEEGMYLGFSHLHSFLSSIFGFGIAGVLLTKYCPDPALFASREAWEAASVNAHYIWYYFAGIGLVAAVALLIFAKTTEFIDKKKKA